MVMAAVEAAPRRAGAQLWRVAGTSLPAGSAWSHPTQGPSPHHTRALQAVQDSTEAVGKMGHPVVQHRAVWTRGLSTRGGGNRRCCRVKTPQPAYQAPQPKGQSNQQHQGNWVLVGNAWSHHPFPHIRR